MARAMMTKILTSIVAATMLIELALAVDHDVGAPSGGWDTSTNLQSWASSQTFTVGDNLVFTYASSHDVLEVSKDDYDSCSTSNPTTTYPPSPNTIPLTASGSRYFICGTSGHCDQGMKVEIKVESSSSSSPPTTTTPSTPSPPDSTPSTPSDTPTPPGSTTSPGTPAPVTKPKPSPSSAETVKMSVVSMVCLGFCLMMMM